MAGEAESQVLGGERERRDPTQAVLARLEQKVDDMRDAVRDLRDRQQHFVTYDRLELEIAARNQQIGGIGGMLSDHIRKADDIVDKRLVPLEQAYQQMLGAAKYNRWLLTGIGIVLAILTYLQLRPHINF